MDSQMIQVDVIETWWDYLLGIATMILAAINVWLIYIIYRWQHKDTKAIEERQRRVNQFNNIFLIPRMELLKQTFDKLIQIASKFESSIDDDSKKTTLSDELDGKIVEFDDNFVSFISGIDSQLYNKVHDIVEGMRDGLSHDVFDTNTAEINGSAYVQKIQARINLNYKSLLNTLFSYDGNQGKKDESDKKGSSLFLYALLGVIVIMLASMVYRDYTMGVPEKITFQLDSTQMKKIMNAMHCDTPPIDDGREGKK